MEGPVASGGMAAVYAAHDTLLDRPVAVKVLAEHLNEDVAARQRFQREARAAAGLSSHPGIVTIFDVGEHDGRSFIVMELYRGGTLGDVLRSGSRPDPARALRWLRHAAEALDTAHERGIVHRDIKPANLLIDDQDNLAVADFGIARLAWEEAVTQTGQILGTASYISPEQAEGGNATDASDRYALAVVAYELITGARPFDGEHFAAQARAHIEDEPTPPTVRDPRLPAAVDAVLARGLAKAPGDRWPTAVAFVDALESALDAGPATVPTVPVATETTQQMPREAFAAAPPRAVPPARPPVDGRFGTPTGARAAAARGDERAARRQMRLPLVLGLGLLALAVVAIVLAAGGSGGDKTASTAKPAKTTAKKTTRKATPAATAQAAATASATAAPAAPSGGDPQSLNDQGFKLFKAGDYAGAVPILQKAVDACGDSTQLVCQYALYNLGASLNRSGHPDQAIPLLVQRLTRFPGNQPGTVRDELVAACQAAGQDCGKQFKGKAKGFKGNGKAKGNEE